MENNFNNDINREKFISLLIELSINSLTTDEKIKSQVKNLKEVYVCSDGFPGYRHYYSDIFKAIIEIDKKEECNQLILAENLDSIMYYCKNNESDEFNLKMNKLYDHTNLEISKLEHTTQQIKKIDEKTKHIESIKKDVDKHTEENKKLKEDLDGEIESNNRLKADLDKQIEFNDNLKEGLYEENKSNLALKKDLAMQTTKIEEMQKQYITILGIFASIVLTSTAEISLSGNILQNFNEGSIYRISLVSTGLVFVLFNVIYILTRFIQEINKKDGEKIKYPLYMWVLNITCVLAVCVTILIRYFV